MIWPAAAAALLPALGTGAMAWAVRGRSSSVFAPSVFRGDPEAQSARPHL